MKVIEDFIDNNVFEGEEMEYPRYFFFSASCHNVTNYGLTGNKTESKNLYTCFMSEEFPTIKELNDLVKGNIPDAIDICILSISEMSQKDFYQFISEK